MSDSLTLPQVGGFSDTKVPARADAHGKDAKGDPGFGKILDAEMTDTEDEPATEGADSEALASAVAAMLVQQPPAEVPSKPKEVTEAVTATATDASPTAVMDAKASMIPVVDTEQQPPPSLPSFEPKVEAPSTKDAKDTKDTKDAKDTKAPAIDIPQAKPAPKPLAPDEPKVSKESPREASPTTPTNAAPAAVEPKAPSQPAEVAPSTPATQDVQVSTVTPPKSSPPTTVTAAKYGGTTPTRAQARPSASSNVAPSNKTSTHPLSKPEGSEHTKPVVATPNAGEPKTENGEGEERRVSRTVTTGEESLAAGSMTKANAMTSTDVAPTAMTTAPHVDGNPTPAKAPSLQGQMADAPRVEHQVGARVREAALESADKHAVAHGVRAEVDLGEGGRIAISAAEKAHSIDVKVDAQARHTAETIAKHAGELVSELRHQTEYARVTVNGQGSFSGGGGSHGGSNHSYASNGSGASHQGGNQSSSSHRDGSHDGDSNEPSPAPRASGRKVRIVL